MTWTHYCGGEVVNHVCTKCLESTQTEEEFRIGAELRAKKARLPEPTYTPKVYLDPATCPHTVTESDANGTEWCPKCGTILADYSSAHDEAEYY